MGEFPKDRRPEELQAKIASFIKSYPILLLFIVYFVSYLLFSLWNPSIKPWLFLPTYSVFPSYFSRWQEWGIFHPRLEPSKCRSRISFMRISWKAEWGERMRKSCKVWREPGFYSRLCCSENEVWCSHLQKGACALPTLDIFIECKNNV